MSKVKTAGATAPPGKEHKGEHRHRQAADEAADRRGLHIALAEWIGGLPPIVRKFGQYFFLVFGVYWILAAWFSSWGDTLPWRLGLTLFGAALVYFSVFYEQEGGEEQLSNAELGRLNMRYGSMWCLGGLAFTVLNRWIVESTGGGTYLVASGAILFGAIQFVRGYYQAYGRPAGK